MAESFSFDTGDISPFDAKEKESVYRVIHTRRDVRHFIPDKKIPEDILMRILAAAHAAPSVGFSQPWHFIVIRSQETKEKVKSLFDEHNAIEIKKITDPEKLSLYRQIKLEGILESDINIAVTSQMPSDNFIAGVGTMPETTLYSSCLAIQNIWLAARAEGIGLCWVSVVEREKVEKLLGVPEGHQLVGYLCLGYPHQFREKPHLEEAGWKERETLEEHLFHEKWGQGVTANLQFIKPHENVNVNDVNWKEEAQKTLDSKTKPRGSLGVLEEIAVKLCEIQKTITPDVSHKRMLVFAGDHGVTEEGVSPFPKEVTRQMVFNFLEGGAGINVLTRQHGIEMNVVDVGVGAEWPDAVMKMPGFINEPVKSGTANFTKEPAMSIAECDAAIEVGRKQVRQGIKDGVSLFGIGEMGIGNTTSSSALYAALLDMTPEAVCGRGAGAPTEMISRKIDSVAKALKLHEPEGLSHEELGGYWLRCVGGLEIAAMAGVILECYEQSCAVVIDGFIATSAALAAITSQPLVKSCCFFAHISDEKAHHDILHAMNVKPLLHLNLRLGEGTGAALAMPVIESGAKILNEMSTFESAKVSNINT